MLVTGGFQPVVRCATPTMRSWPATVVTDSESDATEFWSVEFSTQTPVPEWGDQKVRMMREEDAVIDENGIARFLAGPQMTLWLIRSESE